MLYNTKMHPGETETYVLARSRSEKGRRLDTQGSPLRRIGTGNTSHRQTPTILQWFLEPEKPESHEHWPVPGSARDEKELARGMETRGEWGLFQRGTKTRGDSLSPPFPPRFRSSRPLLRVSRGARCRLLEHRSKYLGSLSAEGSLQVWRDACPVVRGGETEKTCPKPDRQTSVRFHLHSLLEGLSLLYWLVQPHPTL